MSEHAMPARVVANGMTGAPPQRSIEQYLADLQAEYDRLPLQHPRRGRLTILIRQAQDAIDERSPL